MKIQMRIAVRGNRIKRLEFSIELTIDFIKVPPRRNPTVHKVTPQKLIPFGFLSEVRRRQKKLTYYHRTSNAVGGG